MGKDVQRVSEPFNEDFWRIVEVLRPKGTQMVSLRVDKDVLDWFKAQGKGYQSYMNAVLTAFAESKKRKAWMICFSLSTSGL